jgi:chaperone modulatory protein CbpM
MTKDIIESMEGIVVSEEQIVSIVELCQCCDIPAEVVLTLVEYGIIEPLELQSTHTHWQFTGDSVLRVKMTLRLQRDLEVNLAGVALAIELLDEIKTLRRLNVSG